MGTVRRVSLILAGLLVSGCTDTNSSPDVTTSSVRAAPPTEPTAEVAERPVVEDGPRSVAGPLVVDLRAIATPNPSLLKRWRDLTAHGYGIGPARPDDQEWSDLAARHVGIDVAEFRLGWGVDSGAHLVVVEGATEGIASARAEIDPVVDVIVEGNGWLAGLSRRDMGERWELRDLGSFIAAIREPEVACTGGDAGRLCPLGPEVGPSPPPRQLILAGSPVELALPVDVRFLGPEPTGLRGAGGRYGVSWVSDDQAVLEFTPTDPVFRGENVVAANNFGGIVVSIEVPASDEDRGRSRIAFYDASAGVTTLAWVPGGWVVDGLTLATSVPGAWFRYEVIVVGSDASGEPIAVAVDADGAVRGLTSVSNVQGPELDELPPIDLGIDRRWTLPQWTPAGVTVVAERSDGWYLVDDIRGERTDLLRSSHPIIGYALDQSARHAVLAIDGPTGVVNYWISDDEIVELASTASSMAWFGSHQQ